MRYFRHPSCEPQDEITADEAAALPDHVRRREVDGATVTERVRVESRADGTVAARAVAQLDGEGRPTVEEWFDAAGGFKSRDVYTWRGDDLVRVVTHLADGSSFVAFEDDDA